MGVARKIATNRREKSAQARYHINNIDNIDTTRAYNEQTTAATAMGCCPPRLAQHHRQPSSSTHLNDDAGTSTSTGGDQDVTVHHVAEECLQHAVSSTLVRDDGQHTQPSPGPHDAPPVDKGSDKHISTVDPAGPRGIRATDRRVRPHVASGSGRGEANGTQPWKSTHDRVNHNHAAHTTEKTTITQHTQRCDHIHAPTTPCHHSQSNPCAAARTRTHT